MSVAGLLLTFLFAPVEHPEFSRPVRVVAGEDAVYVANAANGTISVLDPQSMQQRSRLEAAKEISDFVPIGKRGFAVVDPKAEELLIVDTLEKESVRRVAIREPGRIAADPQHKFAAVTSRWRKRVEIIDLETMKLAHSVSLNFEPHEITHLEDDRFFVADAFGGYLSVIKTDGTSVSTKIRAQNIRGLLVRDEEVLISHQQLSEIARTDFSDVHWGSLIQSVITRIPINELAKAKPKTKTIALSDVGRGGADPGTVLALNDGRLVAVLQGVDEVVVSPEPTRRGLYLFEEGIRFDTGKRPVHAALSPAEDRLYVANSFDDSVTVIPIPERRSKPWQGRVSAQEIGIVKTYGHAKDTQLTAVQRGERAFFSGKLAHDGWLSCNSCHIDGHTSGMKADTFGDGSFGAPKLVPSLLGVADTEPWGWSGNFSKLEEQIHKSIETTMRGEGDVEIANDIAAYLRTLKPRRNGKPEDELVAQGSKVFEAASCINCHESDRFTSDKIVDVGFKDKVGQTEFNPPSLRGLSHRRTFFHDARAKSLDEALKLHLAGLKKQLSKDELKQLKHYLRSL